MKICLCDDEKVMLHYLTTIINKWNHQTEITCVQSAEEFLFEYQEEIPFDVIFLDIQMDKISGVELAKKIREVDNNVIIIFLTGVKEHVFDGYVVKALRYVLKPIKEEEIIEVLELVRNEVKQIKRSSIFTIDKQQVKIYHDEIQYIEANKHYIVIYTKDNQYQLKMNISQIVKELNDECFIISHRSYIVNIKNLKLINKVECVLDDGRNIPISRNKYKEMNNAFIDYWRDEV